MIAAYALATGLYLLLGRFWWRRIVIPGPDQPTPGREGPGDLPALLWRLEAQAAEAQGDLTLLLVKATFLLLWPLAIVFGIVSARIG